MPEHRKVLRNGRSAGTFVPKIRKVMAPPEGEPWAWHSKSMLESPAWQALSINARRFLDFLEIEHMAHGGAENGRLRATYDQLVRFGLTRELISAAIDETEALGFVRRTRPRQMRVAMTYRLTWFGAISREGFAQEPTNEWRHLSAEAVAEIIANMKSVRRRREDRRNRNQNSGSGSRTSVVRVSEPDSSNRPIRVS